MKKIVIVGAGGFGREVAWLIEDINAQQLEWSIAGFVDDNPEMIGKIINGYPVLGNIDWLAKQSMDVAIAVGDPRTKRRIVHRLLQSSNTYPNLIHPSVIISKRVELGKGVIICAGNIVTVNIVIRDFVIINLDCTIGHDAVLNDYVTVLPSVNVSGGVILSECVSVGTGSAIIQGLQVGENTIIGAGATVVKELPANCVAVGSPAKPIRFFEGDEH
jgi:sugar O-acyltransferase (sialic acid O-acetyltransferase NeuD family)